MQTVGNAVIQNRYARMHKHVCLARVSPSKERCFGFAVDCMAADFVCAGESKHHNKKICRNMGDGIKII